MTTQSVFLFPGQGSQFVGMGQDLQAFQEFSRTMEEASDALSINMQNLCFEDSKSQLNLTEFTQPAILAVSTGIFRILKAHSHLSPVIMAGHSLGEYSALVALGALDFTKSLQAVRFRGQAMQRAVPVGLGAMAAYLGSQGEEVKNLCHQISTSESCVEIANDNCPTQLVLSGHTEAVDKVIDLISKNQLGRAKKLAVSAPFHSSLMSPAADEMKSFFQKTLLKAFSGKIIANINAEVQTQDTYTIDMLVKQIASPVLWTQTMHTLNAVVSDVIWVEVGPGKVLQGLAKKTFPEQKCFVTNDFNTIKSLLDANS